MFRLITEFQDPPTFFVLCGNANCAMHAKANLPTGEFDYQQVRADFFNKLRIAGWLIDIGNILCPQHLADVIAAQQKAIADKPMIVVPSGRLLV